MELKTPILFINFKTYEQATGKNSLILAKFAQEVAKEHNSSIILVPQAIDMRNIKESTVLPIFAQHIDPINYGSNTGQILPEAIKDAGAIGTVLNHAENKRTNDFIEKAVQRAKEIGLKVMICAETIQRAKEVANFDPDLIAIEPPELIGGDRSVSSANPEIISGTVKAIKEINSNIKVICGAGIKNKDDVIKSLELGAEGVFVASGVIKATNIKDAIKDLVEGFKG